MNRPKHVILAAAAAALLVATSACSSTPSGEPGDDTAIEYPTRTITMIVPFSPGGGTDIGARLLADALGDVLGKTITVLNREGAGSQTGLTELANADPDGYTLGFANMPAMNTILLSPEREATFDVDSFDYIANHVLEPLVIAVEPDSPMNSLGDLVDAVATGELRAGTSGRLTPEHLAALQLQEAAGSDLRIAHFGGAAESLTQFRSGSTDFSIATPTAVADLKVLAVLTAERHPMLPDVPTAAEQGFESIVMASARGLVAPAGLPESVLEQLRSAAQKAMEDPAHMAAMEEASLTMQPIFGEEFAEYVLEFQKTAQPLVELAANE